MAQTAQQDDAGIESYTVKAKETSAENKEELDKFEAKFKGTQTYENLNKLIPSEIKLDKTGETLQTNKKLLERIVTNVGNIKLSERSIPKRVDKYSDILGKTDTDYTNLGEVAKEELVQKLSILEACHDNSIIHLSKEKSKSLAQELLISVGNKKIDTTETKESTENIKINEDFKEDPAFPMLNKLVEKGIITEDDFDKINEYYSENGSLEGIDKTNLNSDAIKYIIEISKTTDANKRTQNFLSDFSDSTNDDLDTNMTLKLISENYIQIKSSDGSTDTKINYFTAIEVAAKKVLYGVKNIDRNSETFKTAMTKIENGNREERFKGLKTILILKGQKEGQFGNRSQKEAATSMNEITNHQESAKKSYRTNIEKLISESIKNGKDGQELTKHHIDIIRAEEAADKSQAANDMNHTGGIYTTSGEKLISSNGNPVFNGAGDLDKLDESNK